MSIQSKEVWYLLRFIRWVLTNINKFKKLFELLNTENYRSHNGNACGLHVHIGKQGLGLSSQEKQELQNHEVNIDFSQNERIGDVATNINIQLERFKDEIHKFSRRKQQQVDRWCSYLNCDIQLDNGQTFIDKDFIRANTKPQIMDGRCCGDRYKALNLTNSKTVELRLFRGTLKWTTFYYTMNLVNNLVFNAKLENTIVEWKDLAFRGLSNRDKSLCKAYCNERNIELDRNKVVALNYSKKINRTINKQALLDFILNDEE